MLKKLTLDDFKIMPWKNGLGSTLEIFRIDENGMMAFRVSSAVVEQSGPFSDFSGYDRTLVNLGPGEMELSIGDQSMTVLQPLKLIHFDGGHPAQCHVTRCCEDLNIFCDRNLYFASTVTRVLQKPEFIPLASSAGLVIFVIEGELCAHTSDRQEMIVGQRQALLKQIGEGASGGRVMLASASEKPCVISVISFTRK